METSQSAPRVEGETSALLSEHCTDIIIDVDAELQDEDPPLSSLLSFHDKRDCTDRLCHDGDIILHLDNNLREPDNVSDDCIELSPERDEQGREVCFHVGRDRQLLSGMEYELAAVSPVLRAMFDRWKEKEKEIVEVEIPEVDTQTFGVILRYAAKDSKLCLTEDNVWEVLRVADLYQVLGVVQRCFHFLLYSHQCRKRSRHLCMVLETAHDLGYTEHYEKCMAIIKQKASKILRSSPGLSVLCQACMLKLIKSDDITVPEIVVHEAVLAWARAACAKQKESAPSWERLRETAGPLVYHVRYLTMPRHFLKTLGWSLRGQMSTCLLTQAELDDLRNGDGDMFPNSRKKRTQGTLCIDRACGEGWKENRTVVFGLGIIVLLLFAIIFSVLVRSFA